MIRLLEDREIEQMSEDLKKDLSFPKIDPPEWMDRWDVHRIVKTLKYFKDIEQEYEDYKLKEEKMNPDECDHLSTKEIAYREWEGSVETLKEAINSFLWIHANPDWTLGECEEVACKIHSLLLK